MRVMITGVHTGLGHSLAKQFLSAGGTVFGVSRHVPPDLRDQSNFHFRGLDLAELETIEPAITSLVAHAGELDLVILNAGVLGEIKDLCSTSLDEIERVMQINVWSNKVIFDTLQALPLPIKQVVAISSGAAFNGSGGWGAYSVSKSALNLLFRVYAHEHPATHFTCLAPGLVQTQILDYVCSLASDDRYPAVARIRDAMGTERMQSPDEAAERLIAVLPHLLEHPSGAFVDIRNLASDDRVGT